MRKNIIYYIAILLGTVGILAGCTVKREEKLKPTEDSLITKATEEPDKVRVDIDSNDIVILYTTDVHNQMNYIGYDGLAAYKKEIVSVCGKGRVALVDCGDCLEGGELGENSSGSAIVSIMDYVGYDVAIPGNHDFKFGVDNCRLIAARAKFAYISCNLRERSTGVSVLKPYTIVKKGGKNIAFIGVTTPNSTFSFKGSTDFARGDGVNENPTYDFWEDALYERVQIIVDEVRSQEVDYVILLSHLGRNSSTFGSAELISKTTGIDAVIDGHAHLEVAMEQIENAKGDKVTFTSSGKYIMNIGELVIDEAGNITTSLVRMADYLKKDSDTTEYIKFLSK